MKTQALTKAGERLPFVLDDFFKSWNDRFDGGLWGSVINVPPVNITEQKDDYLVSLAAPGMKKEDFHIDVNGNLLTISSQKEESVEEKEEKFTKKEYSYASFERCFTLPEEVNKERIEARYEDGILKLLLPKNEEAKKRLLSKHIEVN